MNGKILNLLLIGTSLIGYLEWGKDQSTFIFQVEADILLKMIEHPASVIHPLTILPFVGQLVLVFTLFQKKPNKILTFIGMGGIGILFAMMLVVACLNLNIKIFISAMPFLLLVYLSIRHYRKNNKNMNKNIPK